MKYNKHTVNGITVHIVEGDLKNLRLLQTDNKKCSLSALRYGTDKPEAIINCSYFTSDYAIGRNQGDVCQNTSSFIDKGWLGFAMTDEQNYICGKLDWWDAEKSICGFTPSTIAIMGGVHVNFNTDEFNKSYEAKMNLATGVTQMAITKDKHVLLVTCEKGLSGTKLCEYLESKYDLEFLCCLDGGGSSQMLVNGEWKQTGDGRSMYNGLALVETESQTATLCFKDYKGIELISSITQKNFEGSHINLVGANDFNGRNASDRVDMLAPFDCVVKAIATVDNTVYFESVRKVMTPSGLKKVWFMCTHILDRDFELLGLKVGKTYRQGEPCYTEGYKGIGSGAHIHMEQGFGDFNGTSSTPYRANGQTFVLDGKTYKQYVPCTSGTEEQIDKVFYLADVEVVPRVSTGKTILDLYPNIQFVPNNEPSEEEPSNDAVIMDLQSKLAETELMLTTERKMREIAEEGCKVRDDQITKYEEVIKGIGELLERLK